MLLIWAKKFPLILPCFPPKNQERTTVPCLFVSMCVYYTREWYEGDEGRKIEGKSVNEKAGLGFHSESVWERERAWQSKLCGRASVMLKQLWTHLKDNAIFTPVAFSSSLHTKGDLTKETQLSFLDYKSSHNMHPKLLPYLPSYKQKLWTESSTRTHNSKSYKLLQQHQNQNKKNSDWLMCTIFRVYS